MIETRSMQVPGVTKCDILPVLSRTDTILNEVLYDDGCTYQGVMTPH